MASQLRTYSDRRHQPRAESAAFSLKALPLAVALCFCPLVRADAINPGQAGLPMGGTVASGTVSNLLTTDKLTLTQTTQRAVIDWASFNIASGKEVQFIQPNASAAVLNRVSTGTSMSEISGTLQANGAVLLMNPNGVMFHQGSNINVGSLIVTTGTVDQSAFEAGGASGTFAVTGATTGSITNRGSITAANAGLVALVAPSVVNEGAIVATGGRIRFSGADRGTVSFNGSLFEFAVDSGALGTNATVSNSAGARLEGAHILLTTGDAANLVSGVVNLQGVQQASSAIVVNGNTVVLKSDLNAPTISGSSNTVQVYDTASIQDAVNVARTGGLVHVAAGTYTQPARLDVNKSLTLEGESEAATVIDLRSVTSYGVSVSANDVTLRDFTVYGPTIFDATHQSSYGIKVSPGSTAAFPLRNFSITRVTSRGAGKAELDLNGVNGALIDQVTLNGAPVGNDAGTTEGAGLQLTDSANVTVRNTTTLNNKWGGVALYQANRSYSQQVNNITIEGNNHFTELNPVYMQDESASFDFGSLNIAGFDYAVRNASSVASNQYTWLQTTKQKAYDFAVNLPAYDASYNVGASYIQGWNGSGRTQVFEVGSGNLLAGGAQAMAINTAVNQSASGATINLGAGTYSEQVALNKAGLTLNAQAGAKLVVPDQGQVNGIEISANNVTVQGLEIAGPLNGVAYYTYYRVEPGYTTPTNISRGIKVNDGVSGFSLRNNNIHDVRNGILIHGNNGVGNVIANNRIENTKSGISVQYTGGAGMDITGNFEGSIGNEWGVNLNLNKYSTDSQKQEAPDLAWQQHLLDLSAANSGWFVQDQGFRSSNRTVVNVATSANGGKPGVQGSRLTPMDSVQSGINAVVTGGVVNVQSGSYAESVTVDSLRKLRFNGATLQSLTLNAGAAHSGIGGNVSASGVAGIVFNAPVDLLYDTTLTATSGSMAFNGLLQSSASSLTLNAADAVTGTVHVPSLNVTAGNTVNLSLDVGTADVRAGVQADIAGRATRIGVNAPHGNLTGSFDTVENTGNGVVKVNGRALQSEPVAAVIDNIRFVPVIVLPPLPPAPPLLPPAPVTLHASVDIGAQPATAAGTGGGTPSGTAPAAGGATTATTTTATGGGPAVVATIAGPRQVPVTRSAPGGAGDTLALGQGVEIDLSPGR